MKKTFVMNKELAYKKKCFLMRVYFYAFILMVLLIDIHQDPKKRMIMGNFFPLRS